ncbi:MAG: serine/threonine-protein kinase, partial [Planctomycetota bacterium]
MRHDDRDARTAAVKELVAKYPEHAAAIQMFVNAQERHGADAGDRTGEAIGPYRLSALLGRGGFGEVYRAEQVEGLRRDVALKLIKLGMDSRAILQRFARERDALARMNHDAIAKIYDAGTTASGQPWFAMELVEGQPITAFCDAERLSLRQRLQLFVLVCLGVQHAHQKGVVHRDLKPANVLV